MDVMWKIDVVFISVTLRLTRCLARLFNSQAAPVRWPVRWLRPTPRPLSPCLTCPQLWKWPPSTSRRKTTLWHSRAVVNPFFSLMPAASMLPPTVLNMINQSLESKTAPPSGLLRYCRVHQTGRLLLTARDAFILHIRLPLCTNDKMYYFDFSPLQEIFSTANCLLQIYTCWLASSMTGQKKKVWCFSRGSGTSANQVSPDHVVSCHDSQDVFFLCLFLFFCHQAAAAACCWWRPRYWRADGAPSMRSSPRSTCWCGWTAASIRLPSTPGCSKRAASATCSCVARGNTTTPSWLSDKKAGGLGWRSTIRDWCRLHTKLHHSMQWSKNVITVLLLFGGDELLVCLHKVPFAWVPQRWIVRTDVQRRKLLIHVQIFTVSGTFLFCFCESNWAPVKCSTL